MNPECRRGCSCFQGSDQSYISCCLIVVPDLPCLRKFTILPVLNFIGITDIHWVYAEGINMGEHKDAALASAKATIDQLVSVKE